MTESQKEDIIFRYEYMDIDDFSLPALIWTIASETGFDYDEVLSVISHEYGGLQS